MTDANACQVRSIASAEALARIIQYAQERADRMVDYEAAWKRKWAGHREGRVDRLWRIERAG